MRVVLAVLAIIFLKNRVFRLDEGLNMRLCIKAMTEPVKGAMDDE